MSIQVAPTVASDPQASAPAAAASSTSTTSKGSFASHLQNAKAQRSAQASSSTEANESSAKSGIKNTKGRPETGKTATDDGQENAAAAGAAGAATNTAQQQTATTTDSVITETESTTSLGSIPASASTLKMLGLQPQNASIPGVSNGQPQAGADRQQATQHSATASQILPSITTPSSSAELSASQSLPATSQSSVLGTDPTMGQFTAPGQTANPNTGITQEMTASTGAPQAAMPSQGATDIAATRQQAQAATDAGDTTTASGIPANVAAALGLSTLPDGQTASTPTMTDPANQSQTMAAQPQVAVAQQVVKGQDKVTSPETTATPVSSNDGTAETTQDGNRLNVNDQYIHAHLPNKNTDSGAPDQDGHPTSDTAMAGKQQETAHAGASGSGATTTEQFVLQRQQATTTQDSSTALQFHHQTNSQSAVSPSNNSNSTSSTSSFLLPSGTSVPDTTVVNQMLDHLNLHKGLETSTVNLKLSPQELGELRMEIKVAQDNVKAHIIAQNPQAQEMIDRHLPRLREALAQQGLNLQQIEVSVGTYEHSGGDQFQQQTAWQQQGQSSRRNQTEQAGFVLPEATTSTIESTNVASNALSVLA